MRTWGVKQGVRKGGSERQGNKQKTVRQSGEDGALMLSTMRVNCFCAVYSTATCSTALQQFTHLLETSDAGSNTKITA
jgi:hypothetical protein